MEILLSGALPMEMSPLAGEPADPSILIDIPKLVATYYATRPDPLVLAQQVAFGTSGHRSCSLDGSFNEAHILAITQAICDYRKQQSIDGPLYIGFDTHALSEPAFKITADGLRGIARIPIERARRGRWRHSPRRCRFRACTGRVWPGWN
jgi:hypothetical protein